MILDPDAQGFCASLRERLAQRPCPVPLLELTNEPDLMTALLRERPSLVVLSEEATPGHLDELARTVRARPELAGTALAALVASDVPEIIDRLAGAGFDAVWTKPVHLLDVAALLALDPGSLLWPSSRQSSLQPVPRAREMENHAERTDRR
jgi:CheY-like chemotaxis protein